MAILDIDRDKHSLRPCGIYVHVLCVSLSSRIIECTPLCKNGPEEGIEKKTSTFPCEIVAVFLIQHGNTKVYNLQYVCEKQLKPTTTIQLP
jgi:hypothetical protein